MANRRRARTSETPRDVLTAREAAKYLRLALPTFYRYMWQGEIPSSKIGGRDPVHKTPPGRWVGQQAGGEDVSGRDQFVGQVSALKRGANLAQVHLDGGAHKSTA